MNLIEKNLVQVIRSLEDYDQATNALIELKYKNPSRAGELAFDILKNGEGDSHLQASAFEVLYSVDHLDSLDYISKSVNSVDLLVLRSMLECVTEDSSLVQDSGELQQAVERLKKRVKELSSDDYSVLGDTLDWFNSTFSGLST